MSARLCVCVCVCACMCAWAHLCTQKGLRWSLSYGTCLKREMERAGWKKRGSDGESEQESVREGDGPGALHSAL